MLRDAAGDAGLPALAAGHDKLARILLLVTSLPVLGLWLKQHRRPVHAVALASRTRAIIKDVACRKNRDYHTEPAPTVSAIAVK